MTQHGSAAVADDWAKSFDVYGDNATDIRRIVERLWGRGVDSHTRLAAMLDELTGQPPHIFWPVFCEVWSTCDNNWMFHDNLLRRLRYRHARTPSYAYLPDDKRAFFDALPDIVTVYRGCSANRVKRISWTTDLAVATGFAQGHRWIPVHDPVIAKSTIPKASIFMMMSDRDEKEIVLDPAQLGDIGIVVRRSQVVSSHHVRSLHTALQLG
ncbi:MAG: hypothetical protein GEU87_02420 [Alphaproteobacteria bacterium]|nr:hypothetical protein [Alphaproteobacteria bacterium]